jgi:hypothetical protein
LSVFQRFDDGTVPYKCPADYWGGNHYYAAFSGHALAPNPAFISACSRLVEMGNFDALPARMSFLRFLDS